MSTIKLFETQQVRSLWDSERETWFFSIVDVVKVLTDSVDAGAYWRKLKQRLKAEGNETVTNCHGLKMTAPDGKMRLTDVADTQQLLRLIQSIPSPKAEATTTEISKEKLPEGFEQNRTIAKQGGTVAGNARKEIELKTGKPIVSAKNAKRLK